MSSNRQMLSWFGLVAWLCAGCEAEPPLEGARLRSTHQQIVGGEVYDPSLFPAVGFLRERADSTQPWSQFGTATLVGQRTVVTAGHCLMDHAKISDLISHGNLEFALGPDEHTVTASSPIVAFEGPTGIDANPDIALAFLAGSVGVAPMALRTRPLEETGHPEFNWLGESVRIIGYGASSNLHDFEGRGVRRSVVLQVVDPAMLTPPVAVPNDIPFLVFHNPDLDNPKGSCNGDSGGPAIHQNPVTGEYEVVAISSGANSRDCIHSAADSTVGASYFYQRTDVQDDLLHCEASQCSNQGACFKPDVCDCYPGFQGTDCSQAIEVHTCAETPCFPGVVCTDVTAPQTGYRCGDCPPGYNGDGQTCLDLDECVTGAHGCHPDATCLNTSGSFSCACADGYVGDGVHCQPEVPVETPPSAESSCGSCQQGPGTGARWLFAPLLWLAALPFQRRSRSTCPRRSRARWR
ncbi:MAG: trypsin-like serine protease [Deltaproteobacteria bacterium]|nr:trypsin-like serine protease [Deltaproteobacteria bacterium]